MTTISRHWLLLTTIALLVTQGSVAAVRALYEPRRIRAPRESVKDLPALLGDWRAVENIESEESALDADEEISRLYRHTSGQQCSVYLAVWHESDQWMPHPPYMCYGGTGFTPTQNQMIRLADVEYGPVKRTRYENSATGQSLMIMYWYQIGNRHYVNREGARKVRRSYWGSNERPPLIKVLMQIEDQDELADQSRMAELASQIYKYVGGL